MFILLFHAVTVLGRICLKKNDILMKAVNTHTAGNIIHQQSNIESFCNDNSLMGLPLHCDRSISVRIEKIRT